MKKAMQFLLAGVVMAGGAWAQGAETSAEGEQEEVSEEALAAEVGDRAAAEGLIRRVREGVPGVPLTMDAEVTVLDKYGKKTGRWTAAAALRPERNGSGKRLVYIVGGGQAGVPDGEMEVWLPEGGGEARYSWKGADGSTELPDLNAALGGADISWTELGFSFFWWGNPRIVGVERLKHRWNCQILELDAPGGGETLRLWVAPSWGAVVQGELRRGGVVAKRFEVESVTKVRKVYMLSEMTVRNAATGGRSRLRISNLAMVAPDYTEEEWERFEEPVRW